ncbi:MAG: ATP-binding protein [Muribaculaceae bacterium]|nr:ATP-binding protein [Muribaculaceae bacterium]
MLYRKITQQIKDHLESNSDKILLVEGARQVGKSYIIRYVGEKLFPNFIEINLADDRNGEQYFKNVKTTEEFYLVLSSLAGNKLKTWSDTLVFLDEIQEYPHLMTMLKFLRQEGRYRYISSGSLLGVTLRRSVSIPVGSLKILRMFPLDFEEFLIANEVGPEVISYLWECFEKRESPNLALHERILSLFRRYLITGGLPDVVNEFLESHNIKKVREIQSDIHDLYRHDAAKYDENHKLKIMRIYEKLPSLLQQQKKRLVFKDIENKKGVRSKDYEDEVDYLIDSGVTIEVKSVSNPRFPLVESEHKNLFKLYLNDVGLLSNILYHTNIKPILDYEESVNLGALYECCVAMELENHCHKVFYYDNKKNGEVDFLVDDYADLSVVPVEVKSGKDYYVHSALCRLMNVEDYHIKKGVVLNVSGDIREEGTVLYLPVYMVMFLGNDNIREDLTF